MQTQTVNVSLQRLDAEIESLKKTPPDTQLRLNGGSLMRARDFLATKVAERDALLAQIAERERRNREEAERAEQEKRERERIAREQLPVEIKRRDELRTRSREARSAFLQCEFFQLLRTCIETENAARQAALQVHTLERSAGVPSNIPPNTPIMQVQEMLSTKHDSHPLDMIVAFLTHGPTMLFNHNRVYSPIHVDSPAPQSADDIVRGLRGT